MRRAAPLLAWLAGSLSAGLAVGAPAASEAGLPASTARALADVLWIRAAQDLPKAYRIDPTEAAWNFRRLRLSLRLSPNRPARTELAGLALVYWRREDLALRLIEEAFARAPGEERLLVALGAAKALGPRGDPAEAARFLERAAALEGAPAIAWKLLAHARERAGDIPGAMAAWGEVGRRYGARDPRDAELARAEIARLRRGETLPPPPPRWPVL